MSTPGLFGAGILVTLVVAAALALLVYAAVLDGRDAAARKLAAPDEEVPTDARSILETARAAGDFGTLVAALERAGLNEALAHDGPYTMFAPSDGAFARLPEGAVASLLAEPKTLTDVLTYHLVPGRLRAADMARRVWAETLQGEDLAISNNGSLRIDGARLVTGDIEASNGVIHVIDRVLLPARI